jgi:hypothetical protein
MHHEENKNKTGSFNKSLTAATRVIEVDTLETEIAITKAKVMSRIAPGSPFYGIIQLDSKSLSAILSNPNFSRRDLNLNFLIMTIKPRLATHFPALCSCFDNVQTHRLFRQFSIAIILFAFLGEWDI